MVLEDTTDFRLISVSILQRETEIQEEKYLTHRP